MTKIIDNTLAFKHIQIKGTTERSAGKNQTTCSQKKKQRIVGSSPKKWRKNKKVAIEIAKRNAKKTQKIKINKEIPR